MIKVVNTKVRDVLPDGTIIEVELSTPEILLRLKRTGLGELFSVDSIDVRSGDEKALNKALSETNAALAENGVSALTVFDIAGRPAIVRI